MYVLECVEVFLCAMTYMGAYVCVCVCVCVGVAMALSVCCDLQ